MKEVVCITESGEKIEMFYLDGEPVMVHPKFGDKPSSLKGLSEQNAFSILPMEERLLIIAFLCASGVYGLGEISPDDEEIREVDAQVKYFGFNPNMN